MDYYIKTISPKEDKGWIASYSGGYDFNEYEPSDADTAFEITWNIAYQTAREDTHTEKWRPDFTAKSIDSSNINEPTTTPYAGSASTQTDKPSQKYSQEEIDLAASHIMIENVINEVNRILESNAITSYSIQNTGYVYFYMSYDFVSMSKDERQVMLDAINNALYSRIAGAGVPYSSYRYFVGETVIAENKRFLDPYSVKLK